MDRQMMRRIAQLVGVLTALFFIAPSFNILPWNIGIFLGIASGMISGTLWSFSGSKEK